MAQLEFTTKMVTGIYLNDNFIVCFPPRSDIYIYCTISNSFIYFFFRQDCELLGFA